MLVVLWSTTADSSPANPGGVELVLPSTDRAAIDVAFGKGVIGSAVPAPRIDDPVRFFTLSAATKQFKILRGPNLGELQPYHFFPYQRSSRQVGGWYQAGNEEKGFLAKQDDGSLVITGVEDIASEAVTRYDPPEPFLPNGIAPGQQREVRISVRVNPVGRADEISHRGWLKVTLRYLGAFRLALPAGTFDAVVMKSTFSGRIGPASLEDVQYRFFAPGAGLLATIESRHISAFLIYQSDTKVAKVLARNSE